MPKTLLPAIVTLATAALPAQGAALYERIVAELAEARRERDLAARLGERRRPVPRVDMTAYLSRMQEGAARFQGTEAAVEFLVWIVKHGSVDPAAAKAAATELLERHARSPRLVVLAEDLIRARDALGMRGARELADGLVEKSPHDLVRAWALYWRGFAVLRDRRAPAEWRRQAERDLAAARELAPEGSLLALRIDAPRFERERLQVGMVAPDIEAEDIGGEPMRLSDHRGKVVVLTFWGDW